MVNERWEPVPGWPEYEASDLGRIRKGGRLLKQRQMESGYWYVTLLDGARRKDYRVHRLIALAFHGEPPDGKQLACHRDGDKDNNRASNIRWDDNSGNQRDRLVHGTDNRGSKHGRAKITESDIPAIRSMIAAGKGNIEIAKLYGVNASNICHIRKGRTWNHV